VFEDTLPAASAVDLGAPPDPLEGPLEDAQGRLITYLRLSITDRCNFRCSYCSPAMWGGIRDLLTADELVRFTGVFAALGIRRVRLTGGEPLLRPDIVEISRRIAALSGIRVVAMTTNASRLEELAGPLAQAGVKHLNISLDTLRQDVFRRISSRGELPAVLRGIDQAATAGFESVKLNVVVMAGVNVDEAADLVRYAHTRRIVPRFIELMPFGKGEGVPTRQLIEHLAAQGLPLTPLEAGGSDFLGPARYLRTAEGGEVGFISPLTENFCGGCNRVRVSSRGELRACLGGRSQVPLAQMVRDGATDAQIASAIRAALGQKPEGHRFNDAGSSGLLLSMMGIGG
jgi:GTP 3',8-cyclase